MKKTVLVLWLFSCSLAVSYAGRVQHRSPSSTNEEEDLWSSSSITLPGDNPGGDNVPVGDSVFSLLLLAGGYVLVKKTNVIRSKYFMKR